MPIGTFIDTKTVAVAATASATLTHGLSTSPHMVWAQARASDTSSVASGGPAYLGIAFGSASISCYNRGPISDTWTVCAAFWHSIIR